MNRITIGLCLAIAASALVAQDSEPTKEQIVAKCKAGGGCVLITRNALMSIVRSASEAAYRQGAESCGKTL